MIRTAAENAPQSEEVEVVAPIARVRADRGRLFRRFWSNRLAVVGLVILVIMVLVAILAPLLAPHHPNHQILLDRLIRPNGDHPLGTDQFGRDQLSRLVYGSRVSLLGASEAVAVAFLFGLPLGMVAGFFGGALDTVLSRIIDGIMSVPALIFALTIVAVLGPGLFNVMLAIGVIFVPRIFRVSRASTLDVRHETFIEASDALGCSTTRTLAAHVLPNILPALLVQVSSLLGVAVAAEASLSFLGLGVRPPTASWGNMVANAVPQLETHAFLIYPPGICIMLLVLAFALVGDGLRTAVGVQRIAQSESI